MKEEGYEYSKHYSSHERNVPYNKEHHSNIFIAKGAYGKDNNIDSIRSVSHKDKGLVKVNSLQKNPMNNSNKEINKTDSKSSLRKHQQQSSKSNTITPYTSTFINKIGAHNSYLSAVIHSLYHMRNYRDYILNDIEEVDLNHYPLIDKLRHVFMKYSNNTKIDIASLSKELSDVYSNKKMFIMNKPADVIDCLLSFITFLHSIYINCPLNEISNISCNKRCFSHKQLWLNIIKVDECECTAINHSQCSEHNYITKIPLETIIHYVNKKGLYESSQRLFRIFNHIIQNSKVLCPLNGLNCNFCITKRTLSLIEPLPQYLIFSYERETSSTMTISDILKALLVIPKYYDFTQLFSSNISRNYSKTLYELYGFVFIKPSKCYTSAFKCGNEIDSNINWVYYDDENVFTMFSLADLISLCIKNNLIPVMFYYTIFSSSINDNKTSQYVNCTIEECKRLELYANEIDNFNVGKRRLLKLSDCLYENYKENDIQRNNSHRKIYSHAIRTSSKNKPKTINDDDALSEYLCIKCQTSNRIECILCPNCGESNEKTIKDTMNKRRRVMDLPFAKNHLINNKVADIPIEYKEDSYNNNLANNTNSNNMTNANTNKNLQPNNTVSLTSSCNNNPVNPYKREKKQQIQSKELKEPKNYDLPMQFPLKAKVIPSNINKQINTNQPINNNVLEESCQEQPIIQSIDNQEKQQQHTKQKTHHNFCINTNYQTNKNQLINISDSSSLISEDRIKLYIDKKEQNTPSNYANIINSTKVISFSKGQTAQKPPLLPEMWICSNCEKVNKANEYKCLVCGLINKKQRELIELNEKRINKSTENNITPTAREINSINQIQLTAPSHSINLNTTFKKVSCVCYSSSRSNIIKNGVCTICHRVLDLMTCAKKSNNIIDKEISYKPSKSGKDKLKDTSSEMTIKIQSTKKQITPQNRYESEEVFSSTNQMIRNVKISKEISVSSCNKRQKSEQCYKKLAQRKNK